MSGGKHSTLNLQRPTPKSRALTAALKVECWTLNVEGFIPEAAE